MKPLLIVSALHWALICASPATAADQVSRTNEGQLLNSVERQFSFSDGPDNHLALSYSSPASSSDSTSSMLSNGLNYSFTQKAGGTFLHFSLTDNRSGTHKLMGGTFGKLKLSFLHGDGDGLNKNSAGISGIRSNFFHGTASRRYRYTGTALAWPWTDKLASHAGTVSIDAPGVDRRSVHFAGGTLGNLSTTLYQIERNQSVGRGLFLGWNWRSFSLGYEALESDYRASWREFSAAYHDSRGGTLRLGFSLGKSDLFADAEDSRVGLTYRFSFGAGKRNSNSNSNSMFGQGFTAAKAATDFDDLSRVGLGAVGIGLVVSSGNPVLDQAPRFPQEPQAAYAILSVVNPVSVSQNLEHGGAIYQNPDGTFSPSEIVIVGTPTSVGYNPHLLVPPGTTATADWHTHGATKPGYLTEYFSPSDIQFSHFYQINGYLGTPMGRMFEYRLADQMVYQYLGPGNNEFILPH